MVRFIWEFTVRADKIKEFEDFYSNAGPWSTLFRKSGGYHGTLLLRDTEQPLRYLTIDRWESVASQRAMRERFAREYEELDSAGEAFIGSERHSGVFEEALPREK